VLHYLVRDCGHLVKLLCTRGGCDKDAVINSKGWRLVHEAAFIGASKALQALLDCGADALLVDNEGCHTLHMAAQEGKLVCVSLLLRFGQPVDCTIRRQCNVLAFQWTVRLCTVILHSCSLQGMVTLPWCGGSFEQARNARDLDKQKPLR
jgi:hypothetical protein